MLTDASNDDDDQPDLHFTIYLNLPLCSIQWMLCYSGCSYA